jgi:hypothetical protein
VYSRRLDRGGTVGGRLIERNDGNGRHQSHAPSSDAAFAVIRRRVQVYFHADNLSEADFVPISTDLHGRTKAVLTYQKQSSEQFAITPECSDSNVRVMD